MQQPRVTEESSSRTLELAKRLKAAGAKMYGAFWCSHCFEQKQAFGKEAMADFPYVECYPDGYFKVSSSHCCLILCCCRIDDPDSVSNAVEYCLHCISDPLQAWMLRWVCRTSSWQRSAWMPI